MKFYLAARCGRRGELSTYHLLPGVEVYPTWEEAYERIDRLYR